MLQPEALAFHRWKAAHLRILSKCLKHCPWWSFGDPTWTKNGFHATTWNIVGVVSQLMSEVWSYFLIFPSALKSIWRSVWICMDPSAAMGCNGSTTQPPSQPPASRLTMTHEIHESLNQAMNPPSYAGCLKNLTVLCKSSLSSHVQL